MSFSCRGDHWCATAHHYPVCGRVCVCIAGLYSSLEARFVHDPTTRAHLLVEGTHFLTWDRNVSSQLCIDSCVTPALTVRALLQMYLFALFLRVLLSWFPGIDWNSNPWTFLRLVSHTHGSCPTVKLAVLRVCHNPRMIGLPKGNKGLRGWQQYNGLPHDAVYVSLSRYLAGFVYIHKHVCCRTAVRGVSWPF